MLPPAPLMPICNQTIIVNRTSQYLVAPNATCFACSIGLTPYIVIQTFLSHKDYCVLVQLLPRLIICPADELLKFWERGTLLPRNKREPLTAITLAVVLGLGAAGAGTGIASLVTSQQQYAQLSLAIDQDLRELQQGLKHLKDSVASLSEVVLQNRRGLDLFFLQEGGLCAALKEECCFYADKTGLVENSIEKVRKSLEERKRKREQNESWYQNWFSASPWLTTLLPSLLGPFIGFLLLLTFGSWAFRKLTSFVKSQVDAALQRPISVHYHRVKLQGSREDLQYDAPDASATAPTEGLKFSTMGMEQKWFHKLWKRP